MNRDQKKEVEDENSIHGIKEPISKSGMAKKKQKQNRINTAGKKVWRKVLMGA